LVKGKDAYPDGLSGPNFDKNLRKNAILVFSHVVKEHGFTTKNVDNISNSDPITKKAADDLRNTFDKNFDIGKYEYSFMWEDADKGKGVKGLDAAIVEAIDEEYRGDFKTFVKAARIDLNKFKGQLLVGDSGVDKRANLDGKPMD
jgi:hypothetical protein